ncbi:MAG: NifU family protein [Firmicutes bacterium]|nr:NifU family protein [Bacillota bacterium]
MEEAVRKVLREQVDPVLSQHFGGSELTKIQDGVAYVKLTGACASCPSAQETIEDIVKNYVCGSVDGIRDVVLDNSVSDELLDMAKKILRHEI